LLTPEEKLQIEKEENAKQESLDKFFRDKAEQL
jgi:hypothetical protein